MKFSIFTTQINTFFCSILEKFTIKFTAAVRGGTFSVSTQVITASKPQSSSAPYVIAPVEVILILYKKYWKKTNKVQRNDITRQEFMDWTNGLWTFSGQSKKGAGGHPAPFPIELAKRCIKLFSYIGDTVLDPFSGSGSTLIAAQQNKRKGIGVDIDKDYCDIAINRLKKEAKLEQHA